MNVLFLINRDLFESSTQYRIAQYAEFLQTRGVAIEFIKRDDLDFSLVKRIRGFDLVFNQKCLMRCSLARQILANSHRTIFDFDDAIYTRHGRPYSLVTAFRVRRRLHLWLKHADLVTTANQVLARYARQFTSSVTVIPMAIDLDHWKPALKNDGTTVTIGWTGAPVNVPYLERLDPVLTVILRKYPFVKLAVSSGQKPSLNCPFEYHPFQPGAEPEFVRRLDIGLLPLPHDEFGEGKSPIKAIQYLACGVPVVGNVFGATAEILNDTNSIAVSAEQEWIDALERLINDRPRIKSLGQTGRQFVLQYHNNKLIGEQLFKLIMHGKAEPQLP